MKLVFPPHLTMSLVAENKEEEKALWELMERMVRTTPSGKHHPTLYLNGTVDEDKEKQTINEIEFS